MKHVRVLCILILMLGVTACTGSKTVEPVAPSMSDSEIRELLFGHIWVAESIAGKPVVDASHTSILFNEDGSVKGRGGCNSYAGRFTLENGVILFSPLATTMKMCAPALADQEERYFEALQGAQYVSFDNDLLHLVPTGGGDPIIYAMHKED